MIAISYLIVLVTIKGSWSLENYNSQNPLEQKLFDFFEKWRNGSCDALGYWMPRLDLIQISPLEGELQDSGVKLSYSTSDMLLKGLNNFTVEKLSASLDHGNASLEVLIQTLVLTADHYDLNGKAYLIYPLRGSGELTVKIQDTRLSAHIQLGSNKTSTWIQEVTFDFDVGEIEVDLVGSTWPINSVLNKQGLNILAKYHDFLVSTAEDYFALYANEYLSSFTVSQLLDPAN